MSRRSTSELGDRIARLVPALHRQSISALAHLRRILLFQDGFVSSLLQDNAMVRTLNVQLQSRMTARKTHQVDLRLGREFLILPHHLAMMTSTEDSKFCQTGELFQLFQHVRLEVPVLTELLERVVNYGVLLLLSQGIHLPLPFERIGAVLSNPRRVVQ